ncbi:alpha/beta-hydrolase [Corynespora cassiicola Philippines]|uniref:Alpha/beta-hydrolase n=1 Tax=Corynespora cassiicola Philippines TaxID=1448308 RepID=A0A2T2P8K0_CORCC|nr:alpha/beta-hydrolase [Corynespora cassiicola Philippines]
MPSWIIYIFGLFVLLQGSYSAKTPVSQALYDQFLRYTRFSAAAYAALCPNPPGSAVVARFFDQKATDTQAFLMRDDSTKELILTFRGTSTAQDLITDFDQELVAYTSSGVTCNGCTVHKGYLEQWNSIADAVKAAIQDQSRSYKLTITGHSMGASLAVLAASSLKGQEFDLICYSFGQPRTGNSEFADYINTVLPQDILFRVTHENDGVPQTITMADGYRHHKTEYWALDPPSARNTFQCEGDEPVDCNNSVPGTGLGANGTGINAAHLRYFGISIGNPLNPGLTDCF